MINIYFIIALVVAVTVHEFSHAWMATFLGDPTARMQGRLSLNPLKHLDPVGTIMLFIAGIGWGRPVPYDPRHLKKPLRDSALIALAGPLSNLLVVFVLAVPFRMLASFADPNSFSIILLQTVITLNLVLMIFNLIPIPPLDGSKVIFSILPRRFYPLLYQYKNYGYGVLILVLLSPRLFGFSILGRIISPVVETVWRVILI
jgi:Zn-dependent protease